MTLVTLFTLPILVLVWVMGYVAVWAFRLWRRSRPRPAPLGYVRLADRYFRDRSNVPE